MELELATTEDIAEELLKRTPLRFVLAVVEEEPIDSGGEVYFSHDAKEASRLASHAASWLRRLGSQEGLDVGFDFRKRLKD